MIVVRLGKKFGERDLEMGYDGKVQAVDELYRVGAPMPLTSKEVSQELVHAVDPPKQEQIRLSMTHIFQALGR